MTISLMTWKPDTCDCVLEESHDPSDSSYGVKFSRVISKCSSHEDLPDNAIYGAVYSNSNSDQKRKNLLEKFLIETDSLGVSEEVLQDDGTTMRQFKKGITYTWNFTGKGNSRILNVSLSGVTLGNPVKATINTFLSSTFGSGKVIL